MTACYLKVRTDDTSSESVWLIERTEIAGDRLLPDALSCMIAIQIAETIGPDGLAASTLFQNEVE